MHIFRKLDFEVRVEFSDITGADVINIVAFLDSVFFPKVLFFSSDSLAS